MLKKVLFRLLTVLLLAVFLVSGGMVLYRQFEYVQSAGDYDDALRVAGLAESKPKPQQTPKFTAKAKTKPAPTPQAGGNGDTQESQPEPASTPAPEDEPVPLPEEAQPLTAVDLPALQSVNPEVVGWLEIPDVLSFPLLHTQDNQHYLTHSWNNSYNSCGSIFLECQNQPDFSGFHTIIYGHRMDNDAMFGVLRFYQEPGYWQEHPLFYVYDGDTIREYEIFSVFEADVQGIVYRLDLEERKEEFISQCVESSEIDTGIVPSPEEQFVTLSTCPRSGYATRLVVMAHLINEYSE